jgi:hypothetical protein
VSRKFSFSLAVLAMGLLLVSVSEEAQPAAATDTQAGNKVLLGVLLAHPNRGAALSSASNWDKDVFPSEFRCCDLLLPRPITDRIWFVLGFDYAEDFNDGTVLRTKDGGVTWSTLPRPEGNQWWQDFAADAYGRLWGVTLDTTTNIYGTMKIWYSDDGGDNWIESYSRIGTQSEFLRIYRIVTHPSNPLILAVYGRTDGGYKRVVIHTTNGGQPGSWVVNTDRLVAVNAVQLDSDLVLTAGGRLVVAGEITDPPGHSVITTSDDFGLSWTQRMDFGSSQSHRNLGPVGKRDGSALYVVHVDTSMPRFVTRVWQSSDEGATWEPLDNEVPQHGSRYSGNGGIAYDERVNAIYVANSHGRLTVEPTRGHAFLSGVLRPRKIVMKMNLPAVTGTWVDVSNDLVPFGRFSRYSIPDTGQYIAVTPARLNARPLKPEPSQLTTAPVPTGIPAPAPSPPVAELTAAPSLSAPAPTPNATPPAVPSPSTAPSTAAPPLLTPPPTPTPTPVPTSSPASLKTPSQTPTPTPTPTFSPSPPLTPTPTSGPPETPGPRPNPSGFKGPSYSGAVAPTGAKAQSKLWYHDGIWWGSMFSASAGDFHIHRLDWTTQTWTDTGVLIDTRNGASVDTLWDDTKLYVASVVPNSTTPANAAQLRRYSYNASTDTYTLDSGFPVTIVSGHAMEMIVLAKDTNGSLWVTYTRNNAVWVVRTTTNDAAWGTPFTPPVNDVANLTADDVSAIVAFDSKIGVMWGNQNTQNYHFASHDDGAGDMTWHSSVALAIPQGADDHINLKALSGDSAGRVFAAVKTSRTSAADPLIMLLVLKPDGTWTNHTFSRVSEKQTRPIVTIDQEARTLYMFAAQPCCSGDVIFYKQAGLDAISFAPGSGASFMDSAEDNCINNVSSTRQNLTSSTDLVAIAAADCTRFYFHNVVNLPQRGG